MPALMAITAIVGLTTARTCRTAGAKSTNRHNARQITTLVRDYLGELGALDRALKITVEQQVVPRNHHLPMNLWTAECEDLAGRYVGFVLVDDDNGQIVSVNCSLRSHKSLLPTPLSRSQAVSIASSAVRRFPAMRSSGIVWLDDDPTMACGIWSIPLRGRTQAACIALDASTGAIVSIAARVTPCRPARAA